MTGDRGMEQLLGGTARNYLPSSWTQLTSALAGGGQRIPALCPPMCRLSINAECGLVAAAAGDPVARRSAADHSGCTPVERHATGAGAAGARQPSSRFAAIQSLIAAISTATRSERNPRSAGADQRRARHAAERTNQAAECSIRRLERKSPRCASRRWEQVDRRARPIRARFQPRSMSAMGFFATFWTWLNGQLATYRRQHRASGGVLEPRWSRWRPCT